MQKVSEIGRTVVSSEDGERIGRVSDLLLDPGSHQVVGLVLAGVPDADAWHREGIDAFRFTTLIAARAPT